MYILYNDETHRNDIWEMADAGYQFEFKNSALERIAQEKGLSVMEITETEYKELYGHLELYCVKNGKIKKK